MDNFEVMKNFYDGCYIFNDYFSSISDADEMNIIAAIAPHIKTRK